MLNHVKTLARAAYARVPMLVIFALIAALDHALRSLLPADSGVILAMALASYAGSASYDQANAHYLDLSDVLSAVLLADTFFLGRVPMGEAGTQTVHYWTEDTLNATVVTVAIAISNGDTSLVLGSGQGAKLRIGALLQDEAILSDEVMQVTAISTDTITVARSVGDSQPAASGGEAHAAACSLRVIGMPVQEGDSGVTDMSVIRSRKSNTFQIFKREVEVSGTTKAIKSAGVPNEFNYQIAQRMLEIHRELGMAHLTGVQISAGSDTVYRSMDGVSNVVRIGANTLTAAEALSESTVNALCTLIWNKGGQPNLLVGHDTQMTKFAELYKDKIRLVASDRQVGRFITKFLTDKGIELDLLTDRWAKKHELLAVDSSRLSLHPLVGRAMHMEPLAKTGDADRAMIIGEYTQVTRNAAQSHALHRALTA